MNPNASRTSRVVVLAPDPAGAGGIERATRVLLRALDETFGPTCVTFLPFRMPGRSPPGPRRLHPVGGRLVRPAVKAAYARSAVASSWRRGGRGAVIIACHLNLAPLALVCRAASGAPYVVWCHGIEAWGELRGLRLQGLRRADRVFAPSAFTARRVEEAAGLPPGSVSVVPHALAPELPVPAAHVGSWPRARRALAVARLATEDAYKGIDTLIGSWPRVLARVPEAELQIVGDGPDRPRLERLAALLGVERSVRFTGRIDDGDLARAYAGAGLFALPGRFRLRPRPEGEGFGLVFLEAAAWGLPAVAGNGGAVPEVVVDGETGVLVDPEEPAEVADAVVRLLLDPEEARRLGEAARRRAEERFSYERFRQEIRSLLERVTTARCAGSLAS